MRYRVPSPIGARRAAEILGRPPVRGPETDPPATNTGPFIDAVDAALPRQNLWTVAAESLYNARLTRHRRTSAVRSRQGSTPVSTRLS